jgi:hypothetical protein
VNVPAEIIAALIGGVVVLVGQYILLPKTDAEAMKLMGENIDRLEIKVTGLRERVESLENERDQNKRTINALRDWARRVLAWLKAQNMTGYPEPDNDLLDTGDRMKAVKK